MEIMHFIKLSKLLINNVHWLNFRMYWNNVGQTRKINMQVNTPWHCVCVWKAADLSPNKERDSEMFLFQFQWSISQCCIKVALIQNNTIYLINHEKLGFFLFVCLFDFKNVLDTFVFYLTFGLFTKENSWSL